MARIAGVDLPRDKRVEVGLTYIYGIGPATAKKIVLTKQLAPEMQTGILYMEGLYEPWVYAKRIGATALHAFRVAVRKEDYLSISSAVVSSGNACHNR